jgi:hypothetical protein
MLRRLAVLLYGSICYIVFLATFLYTVGFIGNILVPRSIDGPRQGNLAAGLAVDIALLLGFAIQHSVMARPGSKRWMTRFVPECAERSTYVLASSLALIALFAFWHKSFRFVRAASGLAQYEFKDLSAPGLQNAGLVSRGASSALPRLDHRILGDAYHDGNAPAVLGRDDPLHPRRNPLRRTRSRCGTG